MNLTDEQKYKLVAECKFSASRSSGPGGQNVNKLNTKVELRFSILNSRVLSELQKEMLISRLKNKINNEFELVLISQTERTQWKNKEKVTEKFFVTIEKALKPPKKRIKTKPSKASKLKRLESKKQISAKKQLRKTPEW